MKDRHPETSTTWGVRGLKVGAVFGGGIGALIYTSEKRDWEKYKQNCFRQRHVPAAYLRPHLISYIVLPLVTTAAIMGGVGYMTEKAYDKIQYPAEQTLPTRSDKWANNGFKVGISVGFGISYITNHLAAVPRGRLLKASATVSIVGGILCSGVGLFAGTVVNKLKDNNNISKPSGFSPY